MYAMRIYFFIIFRDLLILCNKSVFGQRAVKIVLRQLKRKY